MLETVETGTNNKCCSSNMYVLLDFVKITFARKVCVIPSETIAYVT